MQDQQQMVVDGHLPRTGRQHRPVAAGARRVGRSTGVAGPGQDRGHAGQVTRQGARRAAGAGEHRIGRSPPSASSTPNVPTVPTLPYQPHFAAADAPPSCTPATPSTSLEVGLPPHSLGAAEAGELLRRPGRSSRPPPVRRAPAPATPRDAPHRAGSARSCLGRIVDPARCVRLRRIARGRRQQVRRRPRPVIRRQLCPAAAAAGEHRLDARQAVESPPRVQAAAAASSSLVVGVDARWRQPRQDAVTPTGLRRCGSAASRAHPSMLWPGWRPGRGPMRARATKATPGRVHSAAATSRQCSAHRGRDERQGYLGVIDMQRKGRGRVAPGSRRGVQPGRARSPARRCRRDSPTL
jgi:hypothetical protein